MPRSRFARGLLAICLLALALRLWYVLSLADDLIAPGDAHLYRFLAFSIEQGHGYSFSRDLLVHDNPADSTTPLGPTAAHPPLYPLYLAAGVKLGLTSFAQQRVLDCLLGVATVALIGVLGRTLGGNRVGIVAAGLAAVYPPLFMIDGAVTAESLYAPLLVVALLAAYALLEHPSRWKSASLGVVIGLAALTRSEGVFLLALLAAPVIWQIRRDRLVLAVVCAAATALMLAPWTIRNAIALDRFVPLSTNGGLTQAATNCRETYYDSRYVGFVYHDCALHSPCLDLANEAQQSNCFGRQGLAYARQHVSRVPLVAAARVARSWQIYQPSNDIRYGELWGRQADVAWAGVAIYALLVVLAVPGAWLARRQGVPLSPLVGALILAICSTLVAFGFSRYRLPAEPVIVV